MMTLRAHDLRRLNVILRLPWVDVATLNDGQWGTFLDDLYFAVFGERGRVEKLKRAVEAGFDQDIFHIAATRAGVRAAQEGLRAQLPVLQRVKGGDPAPYFVLSEQRLYVAAGKDGFASRYLCKDCPTMIYSTLAYLLERSGVTQRDILTCSNDRCGAFFVPLRKPHAGQRSFCSQKCGSLIAAREYRRRRAGELPGKERERSRKRYEERVQRRFPARKIKISRRPRKPKR